MSLEQALEKHGEKMDRLSAALEAAAKGGVVPSGGKDTTDKTNKGKTPDIAAVKTVANRLVELTDKKTVVALLKKVGKAGSTTELDEKFYAKFITAATAAIKEKEEAEDFDEDDVQTAYDEHEEATDEETADKLLKKIGKVDTVDELDEEHYAAYVKAARAAKEAATEDC